MPKEATLSTHNEDGESTAIDVGRAIGASELSFRHEGKDILSRLVDVLLGESVARVVRHVECRLDC